MSQTLVQSDGDSRSIELESGEVIEGVTRITREDTTLAKRKALVEDQNRMRNRPERRLLLHTPGSGHRVVYPDQVVEGEIPEVGV